MQPDAASAPILAAEFAWWQYQQHAAACINSNRLLRPAQSCTMATSFRSTIKDHCGACWQCCTIALCEVLEGALHQPLKARSRHQRAELGEFTMESMVDNSMLANAEEKIMEGHLHNQRGCRTLRGATRFSAISVPFSLACRALPAMTTFLGDQPSTYSRKSMSRSWCL